MKKKLETNISRYGTFKIKHLLTIILSHIIKKITIKISVSNKKHNKGYFLKVPTIHLYVVATHHHCDSLSTQAVSQPHLNTNIFSASPICVSGICGSIFFLENLGQTKPVGLVKNQSKPLFLKNLKRTWHYSLLLGRVGKKIEHFTEYFWCF